MWNSVSVSGRRFPRKTHFLYFKVRQKYGESNHTVIQLCVYQIFNLRCLTLSTSFLPEESTKFLTQTLSSKVRRLVSVPLFCCPKFYHRVLLWVSSAWETFKAGFITWPITISPGTDLKFEVVFSYLKKHWIKVALPVKIKIKYLSVSLVKL